MKKKTILRISLALSLFLIGLFLVGGTMASGPTLYIAIDPQTGPTGTVIRVTGEGAQTDKLVTVAFVTSGEGGTSLAEVQVTPLADGTFTAAITVPAGTGGGTYAVRAEQANPNTGNLIHYWYNNFAVTGAPAAIPVATAPVVPTPTAGATAAEPTVSATETVLAPATAAEPTVSATETVVAPATAAPTAAATSVPGGLPTTGRQDPRPDNTLVVVVVALAALGVLAALGAGILQARKA
jgi:hypothetical protein